MNMGYAISAAGDMDDDGYDDFLTGATGTNRIGIGSGGTAIVYSGKTASVLAELYGKIYMGCLGRAVHGGKDINGDGLPDMIIGSREDVNGIQAAGKAYVYVSKSLKASDEVPLGGILELNLNVPAKPFGTYLLAFSFGAEPGIPLGTRKIPLNWDILFELTFGNAIFSGTLDNAGKKQIKIRVPNDPALPGLKFYAAFLLLQKDFPKGVRTISNPEEILIKG
jgi:hypothetical protein